MDWISHWRKSVSKTFTFSSIIVYKSKFPFNFLFSLSIFRRSNCDSVAACLQNTDDKWKWLGTEYDGKKYKKDEPLKPINAQGLKYLTIQNGDTDFCVYQQNENFKSAGCSATLTKVCVLTYGGKGIGSTIGMLYLAYSKPLSLKITFY